MKDIAWPFWAVDVEDGVSCTTVKLSLEGGIHVTAAFPPLSNFP